VVVFANLNLSCAPPGEGHFRNLTILRSYLMLAKQIPWRRKVLPSVWRRMRGIRDLNLLYVSYNESATAFSLTCVPSMDAPFLTALTR
jgi:hypothetical protein